MKIALTSLTATLFLLVSACAPVSVEGPVDSLPAGTATIAWDNWGVPHIQASNIDDASYAFGWAMARGRPDQLLELLGQGRGTAAELWGETYLEQDTLAWTFGIPQVLDDLYQAQGPDIQRRLDAYAAGINAFMAAHPEAATPERRRVLPVTARDVLGHGQRTVNLTFVAGGELYGLQSRLAATSESDDSPRSETESETESENGSNAWAIAPSRSASGNALLLANPHLPWTGVFTWFEAHIRTPELNAYGASLLGQPFLSIMFNEHLGWTHTVNRHDAADTYRVTLTEGGYLFDGQVRSFDETVVPLKVRRVDGTLEDRPLALRRTVHGPVLAEQDGHAYAMRVAGIAQPEYGRVLAQYAAMAGAKNRTQWEAAFSRLQLPTFNAVYADDAGEILYVSSGLFPARAEGDWYFWDGVVDGSTSELLWTEYTPYSGLMRVANPPSGFLQNANETGYTATLPPLLNPKDFPPDFITPDMYARPQHSLEMILGDQSISFEELVEYAHDSRLVFAETVLDELIAAARSDPREAAHRAAEVLSHWDRRSNQDSGGAALFTLWAFAFAGFDVNHVYETRWSFEQPVRWPEGIARDEAAIDTLVSVVERMDREQVPLDLPWGEFGRFPDGKGGTLPSSLGIGQHGAFRVGFFSPGETAAELTFNGGTSYVAAIEFGDTVRAEAILPYGNFAERPDGIADQLPLLSRGEFRQVHFARESIRQNTAFRETLVR